MPKSSVVWCWSIWRSPLALSADVDQRVPRELLDHMVEEADAGRDLVGAGPVEIDGSVIAVSLVRRSTVAARCALALLRFCMVLSLTQGS